MKKSKKTHPLALTIIEKRLLSQIITNAPALVLTFERLIKTGQGEIYYTDAAKVNLMLFLLTEFANRPQIKPEDTQ